MKKFLRNTHDACGQTRPEILNLTSEFCGYVHFLDPQKPTTFDEFVRINKEQLEQFGTGRFSEDEEKQKCALALVWLLENGLAVAV